MTVPHIHRPLLGAIASRLAHAITASSLGIAVLMSLSMGFGFRSFRPDPVRRRSRVPVGSVWREFYREFDRSRRYERPLTLGRYSVAAPLAGTGRDIVTEVEQHLRTIDRAWLDGHDLYIMLPETDRGSAMHVLERVRVAAPELIRDDPSVASFPEDGITAASILREATQGPRSTLDAPRPAAAAVALGSRIAEPIAARYDEGGHDRRR